MTILSNENLLSAYYSEMDSIQTHYARVVSELKIVRNQIASELATNPLYDPILRAMIYIRTQTITNIGFEVKEFNQWTCDDIPVSYYPTGMGKTEIAKLQDDIKLLNRVQDGHVYGNIFAAKSLVYVADPANRADICERATQIFPLSLEQFGAYVGSIADAIVNLDNNVKAQDLLGDEHGEARQELLQDTMRNLNVAILSPMNDWRDAYLGKEDDKSEVSRREMQL